MHHRKLVKAWAAERRDSIELFYLPSYSPQLNADLKQEMGKRVPIRTNVKLRQAANDPMGLATAPPQVPAP